MEGKGVLFKKFADIDVFDIELNAKQPDDVIRACEMLEPTFGGINLEDIKAPECFYIEEELKKRLKIPVFHDDQHGMAVISGAAFLNALEILGKDISKVRVVFCGGGAVAIACAKWLWGAIVRQIKAAIVEVDNDRYTTLTQSITALSQSNEAQHAENGQRLDRIEHRVAVVERNIAIHATRLDDGSKRMAEIISKLGDLSSDVGRLRSTQLANSPKEPSDAQ
jgi:malic enzyme